MSHLKLFNIFTKILAHCSKSSDVLLTHHSFASFLLRSSYFSLFSFSLLISFPSNGHETSMILYSFFSFSFLFLFSYIDRIIIIIIVGNNNDNIIIIILACFRRRRRRKRLGTHSIKKIQTPSSTTIIL